MEDVAGKIEIEKRNKKYGRKDDKPVPMLCFDAGLKQHDADDETKHYQVEAEKQQKRMKH